MLEIFKKRDAESVENVRNNNEIELILTLPFCMKHDISNLNLGLSLTFEKLKTLFSSSKKIVRIFVPYADPVVTAVFSPVPQTMIVTTSNSGRRVKGNSVLERLKSANDVLVRYLVENKKGSSLYQVHAKLFIFDDTCAYIGSANLTDTSLNYNLELGIIVYDKDFIKRATVLFDCIFERYAVPVELI
ncbi:MAG: phospholipase D family protein [Planctomycetes bacterium]|nr:phospholipase D family protein [Planctomycetota bacterium]